MAGSLGSFSDASTLAEDIAQRCEHPRAKGKGWQACCPAHDDAHPSLSITPQGEKVLLHCHAGCTPEAIVAALGLTINDLFLRHATNGHKRIVAVYDYYDAAGTLLHQTVRYEPKKFSQRRPDPVQPGEYVWNLQGIEPVLYRLPQVLQAISDGQIIYVVEGEKDVESLTALGLTATCNPMGADATKPQSK